ncbi:hypothetical protein D7V83_09810 [bacterium 0.1xD8-71]|nr:hypothetical protein D7V83_09810 [bacterium 0.1xD8-71]
MAIRITGMYSGLDTESIINELASAQSYKKTKLVKAQKKLSWKQDAWKALNTKIYSFYQKLDDMRLQSSYMKKKTTVSNPNAVKVVSGESTVDGVHTLTVDKMAKRAYLTGGSLETDNGTCFTGKATLGNLGFKGDGKISVNGALGQSVEIAVDANMTINDFVDKLKGVGLNANFDQDNQRIYISSKDTGKNANFTLSANDSKGFEALATLGLLSAPPADKDSDEYKAYMNTAEYKEYAKWKDYATNDEARNKLIADMVAARAAAYKETNDALAKDNEALTKANDYNKTELAKLDGFAEYGDVSKSPYNGDYAELKKDLYNRIHGTPTEVVKKDEHGQPVLDKDGNEVKETVRQGGLVQDLEEKRKKYAELDAKQGADRDEAAIAAAKADVESVEKEIEKASECYSYVNAIATNEATIKKNQDTIDENKKYFTETVDPNDSSKVEIKETQDLIDDVTAEVNKKVIAAIKFLDGEFTQGLSDKKMAHKIQGSDAEMTLNGVKYTSYNNTISVNGMTITALEETDKEVTLSTTTDTDGIYDMIKGLFTEYNKLINEMDGMYNAESAKDYEPLTAEEKEAMSDDEIEEWEKKIKDSLLRRDSTLSTVASAMKSIMLKGVNVGGKNMYLSDFGIATLGYFASKDNERNAYHIDGDQDDPTVRGKDDMLRSMIASDPETVMNFFVGLTNNMHDELNKKMSATTLSSALTVYNDKQMQKEYDNYTDKIKKQEEKLNALMDKWYAKFSAMETALAKMESKNNAVSSMFGG